MHPPPIIHCIPFYGEIKMIHVNVAKKVHQVEWWIIFRFVVGLDTECRPNLKLGEDHYIAILQLCVGNEYLIYQFLHELSSILVLYFVASGSKKM
ncbi:hypothetical protein ACJIZ3_021546 [Penstemon smallii]|uniref:Uncharacterized protein n=1 Tax=Penstemon smallii TaxID=265156 RepID=A0ABD3SMK5_9LAMI